MTVDDYGRLAKDIKVRGAGRGGGGPGGGGQGGTTADSLRTSR